MIRADRVLLVRRAKAPSRGEWAIPGGSVELGETLAEAVEREVLEETGVIVRAGEVCNVFEVVRKEPSGRVRFHYVIVDLKADYVSGHPAPGSDATEVAWLGPGELKDRAVDESTLTLLAKLGFTGA